MYNMPYWWGQLWPGKNNLFLCEVLVLMDRSLLPEREVSKWLCHNGKSRWELTRSSSCFCIFFLQSISLFRFYVYVMSSIRLRISGAKCLLTLKYLNFVCTLCLSLCSPEQNYIYSHPLTSFYWLLMYSKLVFSIWTYRQVGYHWGFWTP